MNLSEIPPAYLLAFIAGIVWGVRLEGRVNQVAKDVARVEDNSTQKNEEILKTMKELQTTVATLNIEITKVIAELKHTRR